MTGKVVQLNMKPQNSGRPVLPKKPILKGAVTTHGLGLDYNHYRETEKVGDPARALLIFPTEMIDTLDNEEWAVKSGDLGKAEVFPIKMDTDGRCSRPSARGNNEAFRQNYMFDFLS